MAAACGAAASDAPADLEPTLFTSGAWARAADSGAATAVYFTLENRGTTADTLRSARAEIAEATGLHISTQHGGMMHMTEIPALPVPPMDSVSFRPLGAHVMLVRLRQPLVDGDSVALTLVFGSGQELGVRASVRRP